MEGWIDRQTDIWGWDRLNRVPLMPDKRSAEELRYD